ncbi:MAG: hypothetical protein H7X97_08655 [Opitutaceae bacterium]|nr:hypothetical protein [Verrucomicrobiales bacterium]
MFVLILSPGKAAGADPFPKTIMPGVQQIGAIAHPPIAESSGLAASSQHPGVFWTHNDGRKKPVLYAISREGKSIAEFVITGTRMDDWEDIAADSAGNLYLADIGNNDAKARQPEVVQIAEPDPKSGSGKVTAKQRWTLQYPGKPFDAEALFVWQEWGYVISKVTQNKPASLYRLSLAPQTKPSALQLVARLPITSPVTGASLTTDGQKLAVIAKSGAWVFDINGEPGGIASAKMWHTRLQGFQIEGCAFTPDGLLVTAESREIFLFTDLPFRQPK